MNWPKIRFGRACAAYTAGSGETARAGEMCTLLDRWLSTSASTSAVDRSCALIDFTRCLGLLATKTPRVVEQTSLPTPCRNNCSGTTPWRDWKCHCTSWAHWPGQAPYQLPPPAWSGRGCRREGGSHWHHVIDWPFSRSAAISRLRTAGAHHSTSRAAYRRGPPTPKASCRFQKSLKPAICLNPSLGHVGMTPKNLQVTTAASLSKRARRSVSSLRVALWNATELSQTGVPRASS